MMDTTNDLTEKVRRSNPLNLILMAGYPGVGKSAIALELAKTLRYPLLDIDDILVEMERVSGIEDWERRGYVAYSVLQGLVAKQMRLGVSTIVDTPLTHQWLRDFMFGFRDACGAEVHVIYCHCPDALAIDRNRMRLAQDPIRCAGRDSDNFYRIKRLYQPIESIASICVDTEKTVRESVTQILHYLNGINGNH